MVLPHFLNGDKILEDQDGLRLHSQFNKVKRKKHKRKPNKKNQKKLNRRNQKKLQNKRNKKNQKNNQNKKNNQKKKLNQLLKKMTMHQRRKKQTH